MPSLHIVPQLPVFAPGQIATPYPIPGSPDLIMGDMGGLYGYGAPYPLVDHPHERTHQHQSFWRSLSHKGPDPKLYPNYPDVDFRDATTDYLVEIEVPGVKDTNEIKCQWTSTKSLVVSGSVNRPAWKASAQDSTAKPEQEKADEQLGTRDAHGDYKPAEQHEPYVLIGERKIGAFRRSFYFPVDVETDKLSAKLEAGVLRLRVPKRGYAVPKHDSKVNIEVEN